MYLGSAQLDKKIETMPENNDKIIFVTLEWRARDEQDSKVG